MACGGYRPLLFKLSLWNCSRWQGTHHPAHPVSPLLGLSQGGLPACPFSILSKSGQGALTQSSHKLCGWPVCLYHWSCSACCCSTAKNTTPLTELDSSRSLLPSRGGDKLPRFEAEYPQSEKFYTWPILECLKICLMSANSVLSQTKWQRC